MSQTSWSAADEYQAYLARWEKDLGPSDVGTFAKFSGRLIKKMTEEEFLPVHQEYETLAKTFRDSVARGDTVNDVVVRLLRDRAATLVRVGPDAELSRK